MIHLQVACDFRDCNHGELFEGRGVRDLWERVIEHGWLTVEEGDFCSADCLRDWREREQSGKGENDGR